MSQNYRENNCNAQVFEFANERLVWQVFYCEFCGFYRILNSVILQFVIFYRRFRFYI